MVSVSLENTTKRFDQVVAVDAVTLAIQRGELFFLLGPSGCGKTTLLRMVAGFCDADGGRILFDERDITRLPSHKRNTGMVFQNYALWPHMTVEANVGYGLDIRRIKPDERKRRCREALAMVRMEKMGARRPNQLSGGQQQRVALARALVIEPDVVLLDEPLSNLDAKLRMEMRDEIRRIHRETGITTIYVTHDQKEALSLAQRMAVMRDGRVEQVGAPREIYDRPANTFVAQFIGQTNLIRGAVKGSPSKGLWEIQTPHGAVRATDAGSWRPGEEVFCSVRPEAVRLGRGGSGDNVLPAKLVEDTYLGEQEQFLLKLPPDRRPVLAVRLTSENLPESPESINFSPESVRLLRE